MLKALKDDYKEAIVTGDTHQRDITMKKILREYGLLVVTALIIQVNKEILVESN